MSYNKPKINSFDGERGFPQTFDTEFQQVLNSGDLDQILDFIRSTGITTNVYLNSNDTQETPVHLVLQIDNSILNESQKLTVIKLLVDNGAPLDIPNKNGEWPIHLSLKNNYIDITKLFIDKKANIFVTDKIGNTPLHYIAMLNISECNPEYEKKEFIDFDTSQQSQILKTVIETEKKTFVEYLKNIHTENFNLFRKKIKDIFNKYYDVTKQELSIKFNKAWQDFQVSNTKITEYNKKDKITEFVTNFFEDEYNSHKKKTETVYNRSFPYSSFDNYDKLIATFVNKTNIVENKIEELIAKANSNRNIRNTLLNIPNLITKNLETPEILFSNFIDDILKEIRKNHPYSSSQFIVNMKKKLDLIEIQKYVTTGKPIDRLFDDYKKNIARLFMDYNLLMVRSDFDKIIKSDDVYEKNPDTPTIINGKLSKLSSTLYKNKYMDDINNINLDFKDYIELTDLSTCITELENNDELKDTIKKNKITYNKIYNFTTNSNSKTGFKVNKEAFKFVNYKINGLELLGDTDIDKLIYESTWLENFVHMVSLICPVENLDRTNETSTNYFGVFDQTIMQNSCFHVESLTTFIDNNKDLSDEEKKSINDYITNKFEDKDVSVAKLRPLQRFYNYFTETSTYNSISFLELFSRIENEFNIQKDSKMDFPYKFADKTPPSLNKSKEKTYRNPLNFITLFRYMEYLGDFLSTNTFNYGEMPNIFSKPMTTWLDYVDSICNKNISPATASHLANINNFEPTDPEFCTSYDHIEKKMTIEPLETLMVGSQYLQDSYSKKKYNGNIGTNFPTYKYLYKSLVIYFIKLVTKKFTNALDTISSINNTNDMQLAIITKKEIYKHIFSNDELNEIIENKKYENNEYFIEEPDKLLNYINGAIESSAKYATNFPRNFKPSQNFNNQESYIKEQEMRKKIEDKFRDTLNKFETDNNIVFNTSDISRFIRENENNVKDEFFELLKEFAKNNLIDTTTSSKDTSGTELFGIILDMWKYVVRRYTKIYTGASKLIKYYDDIYTESIYNNNFENTKNMYLEYLNVLVNFFNLIGININDNTFSLNKKSSINGFDRKTNIVAKVFQNNIVVLAGSIIGNLKIYNTEMVNLIDISSSMNSLYGILRESETDQYKDISRNVTIDTNYPVMPTDVTIEKLQSGIVTKIPKSEELVKTYLNVNYGLYMELEKTDVIKMIIVKLNKAKYEFIKLEYAEDEVTNIYDTELRKYILDIVKKIAGRDIEDINDIIVDLTMKEIEKQKNPVKKDSLERFSEYYNRKIQQNKSLISDYFHNDVLKYKMKCYTIHKFFDEFNKGSNFNSKNINGMTALHIAALNHNVSVIQELIKNNNTIKKIKNNSGKTPKELIEANKKSYEQTKIKQILSEIINEKIKKEMNQTKYNNYIFKFNVDVDFNNLDSLVSRKYEENNLMVTKEEFKEFYNKNLDGNIESLINELINYLNQRYKFEKISKITDKIKNDLVKHSIKIICDEKYSPNIQDIKLSNKLVDQTYKPEIIAELNSKIIDYIFDFHQILSEQLVIGAVNYLRYMNQMKNYDEIIKLL